MKKFFLVICLIPFLFSSCGKVRSVDEIAEDYVVLILQIGEYDENYVDAYFGPEKLKTEADDNKLSLEQLAEKAERILEDLRNTHTSDFSPAHRTRYEALIKLTESAIANLRRLDGEKMTFDELSEQIYDVAAPKYPASYYEEIIAEIDTIIPGEEPLPERVSAFKDQFIIPADKIDTVFRAAIDEAKKRTSKFIDLPENERFVLEYVKNKPWGGYNWYKGDAQSLIQINTDLPIYVDRAIDLACHEGYPGHHVYHSIIGEVIAGDSSWLEYSVYPLFSPEAVISEGTANFGIKVAFPAEERVKFETEVIFPLAGLDPSQAGLYYRLLDLESKLEYARIEAARRYVDGNMTREQAIDWIVRYSLRSRERAEHTMDFIDTYGAYIINYAVGEDLVERYVNSLGGTPDNPEKRCEIFKNLLDKPVMPSDLQAVLDEHES